MSLGRKIMRQKYLKNKKQESSKGKPLTKKQTREAIDKLQKELQGVKKGALLEAIKGDDKDKYTYCMTRIQLRLYLAAIEGGGGISDEFRDKCASIAHHWFHRLKRIGEKYSAKIQNNIC